MSNDGASNGHEARPPSLEDAELSARLKRLEGRLEEVNGAPRQAHFDKQGEEGPSPIGHAVRYSAEFVGGPIVGAGLGWALDRFFGISPWGMIVFLMLGFAAGIYNVLRSSGFLRPANRRDGGDADG
jgi:ATP synthase protein I